MNETGNVSCDCSLGGGTTLSSSDAKRVLLVPRFQNESPNAWLDLEGRAAHSATAMGNHEAFKSQRNRLS